MNATTQTQFEVDALKRAFDAGDVDSVLEYYSDKLEHVEIDAGAPPRSPRTSDFEHIGNALRGAANKLAGSGSESLPVMNGVLDFFGVAGDDKSSTGKILETLKSRTTPEFHKPGDCFLLPEVPNVRVYVLGPPTSAAQLKITQPDKSKHQSYELPQIAPEIDGLVNALDHDTGIAR